MAKIRGKNTLPEILVRKRLFACGWRFRVCDKRLQGKPDIVVPKAKTIIDVRGCFWHRHGCKDSTMPKSNIKFWMEKWSKNVKRDQRNEKAWSEAGWNLITEKYARMEESTAYDHYVQIADKLPKKEVAVLRKELAKLQKNLEGIKEMRRLPNAIVLVDPTVEHNAVAEAKKLGIPVFAICDTSDDPDTVDFPIPSNNDASSAIKLLVGVLADAVVEARGGVTEVAYTKDEGAEATMVDAIRVADIANEQRKAAIRQARKEREERYAKMQAERMARRQAYKAQQEAAKAEEKPAEAEAAAPAAEESK